MQSPDEIPDGGREILVLDEARETRGAFRREEQEDVADEVGVEAPVCGAEMGFVLGGVG